MVLWRGAESEGWHSSCSTHGRFCAPAGDLRIPPFLGDNRAVLLVVGEEGL